MHAILASVGTDGDVYPFIALGVRLRERGHRITLAANERYQTLAAEHEFAFWALVTDAETDRILSNPAFWDQSTLWRQFKNARVAAQWSVQALERQYELLTELARDHHSVLVASPGVFAARIVQEKLSIPLATIYYTPWMIASNTAPPVMPGRFTLPRRAPRPLGKLYWRLVDLVAALLMGGRINRLRKSIGLKPERRVFQWWSSPDFAIGLFPDWYAEPQADWPPQLRVAGFPNYDGSPDIDVSQDLAEFCRAGEPPVAFTFGTGMMFADRYFREATEACRLLGVRGIFLTRHESHLPKPVPEFIHHCRYAPFGELFSRCAAVVHHGGIGTTARALAAGIPQLILPIAWDQPDNAARVKRLGVGDWLKSTNATGQDISSALNRLMTPRSRSQCQDIATRMIGDDPTHTAAKWIEEFAEYSLR